MAEVTIGLAFLAGLASFFSPCIFPLIPAYLAQLTGASISDNKINASTKLILIRSLGFIGGFTIIFLLLGASSTFIGALFLEYRLLFERIGGIIIIIFGLQMIGVISLQMLLSEKRIQKKPKKSSSFAGSLMLGFLFAAAWTPCIGLILSAILYMASMAEIGQAMFYLFIYSMGLGLPFLLVGLIYSKSIDKLRKFNKWLPRIQKISGAIMVALGLLLISGKFAQISAFLAQFTPFDI
ncbi:cytochrome C biogenesis protein DsbD [Alkalihalobacillus alcalophilus ATCC 27647 = CGMCC 1.3604]|uniref:Cytochrome C biogenesis protein DsbD n=1 Tax=Alkalihalobacillus alcalophilus ATCC 27647 = CGMCC 1.3604 TaxID=1218173 RepID=A0A094WPW0_ALKAL|nr:cytochrome c biogenesis protein CcdA [Alkalihalobacillus alcalophilus]KGA98073.1 cytochrome C biogenesis protein DsbD [Alkalihalobacillus alcalophilus ATCC 27647 = CGMCC 1.3604]MED1561041.1 cytochrome c biogenesis protein CcdA [Alkalihalobacillus alcalophilus]THG88336.1 cytochrome C biogenesis protein DsbD [Alkalihalobacillus alcalophilus ATCC 27647 = CGMCC 1.3604]